MCTIVFINLSVKSAIYPLIMYILCQFCCVNTVCAFMFRLSDGYSIMIVRGDVASHFPNKLSYFQNNVNVGSLWSIDSCNAAFCESLHA